jgi:hypothetical protein
MNPQGRQQPEDARAPCGHAHPPGSRFCDVCGIRLPVTCPRCEEVNRSEANFCRTCGIELHGPAPSLGTPSRLADDEPLTHESAGDAEVARLRRVLEFHRRARRVRARVRAVTVLFIVVAMGAALYLGGGLGLVRPGLERITGMFPALPILLETPPPAPPVTPIPAVVPVMNAVPGPEAGGGITREPGALEGVRDHAAPEAARDRAANETVRTDAVPGAARALEEPAALAVAPVRKPPRKELSLPERSRPAAVRQSVIPRNAAASEAAIPRQDLEAAASPSR